MGATVEHASSFPLSASCLVNRAELLSLVERARAELPVELDEAAALLVAHQDVISRAEAEAEQLLAAARARADEMIKDSALVATARGRSEQILDAARTEAARLLREADEYCDRRLAVFEDDLERAMAQVRRGRNRLRERSDLASMDTLNAHGTDAQAEPEDDYQAGAQWAEDGQYAEDGEYPEEAQYPQEHAGPYLTEYAAAEVYDDRMADASVEPDKHFGHDVRPDWEPMPVSAQAPPEHRIVDVAAMERAEAERARLGQPADLQ
jgi:cell division septum initiation protein DivIVA